MSAQTPEEITLAWYVKALGEDENLATESAATAEALVSSIRGTDSGLVPAEVISRAVLEVGADLYYRKAARNGVVMFDGTETSSAVRISRDPLAAAYPFLRPFIPFGLA